MKVEGQKPFLLCRERFEGSLARPLLPQQRVRMLWRDAADPAKGDWYTGMVVQEAEEWAPPAGAIWEGVSVMWDTDSSKSPSFPALHLVYVGTAVVGPVQRCFIYQL